MLVAPGWEICQPVDVPSALASAHLALAYLPHREEAVSEKVISSEGGVRIGSGF